MMLELAVIVLSSCSKKKKKVSVMLFSRNGKFTSESLEVNIVRTTLKSEKISFWFLDDYQGTAFPIVRIVLKS